MAVNPANMESCFPKSKCLSGPNEGVAYDRDSPCGDVANVAFNPVSCDCEETITCVGSDECGYDIDYAIGSDSMYSMRPCQAPSCTIDCDVDEYRLCGQYTPSTGSFYLQPNRCLNKVVNSTNGPCYPEKPAPSGAFTSQYWFACFPGEENPSQFNCGTPVAQMPGGGYCSTAIVGSGIVETGRVPRTKLARSVSIDYTFQQWNHIGCASYCGSSVIGVASGTWGVTFPVSVDISSLTTWQHSSVSQYCPNGPSNCGTVADVVGLDWIRQGTGWADASLISYCGVADMIGIQAEVGITSGSFQKGDIIGVAVVSSGFGAVGCMLSGNTIDSITVTSHTCHRPSDLV